MSVSFSRKQIRKRFNGVSPTEIAVLDGVVAGTAAASKALVLDSSKGIATITSLATTALVGPPPVAAGATKTLTAANAGAPILLDTAAGSVVTLPLATGTGNTYRFKVTTTATSAAHKILTAGTDYINGIAIGFTGSTAKVFASAAATNRSIQMPFAGTQPSGGFIGDYFDFTDVGSALWHVNSMYQAGTTPTTPFSTATT